MLRRVPFEKIENFRDVGGYAARYGETSFGVLYRSGTLADATPSDLDKLADLGVKRFSISAMMNRRLPSPIKQQRMLDLRRFCSR
jgi:hypothetical protein